MWIDTRTDTIKVYEMRPSDPWIKKMTWIPEENAWVLFPTPELSFQQQADIIRQFEAGTIDYATMRMHCG